MPRQISLILDFLSLQSEHLGKIKTELYRHWEDSHLANKSEFSNPDDVYGSCKLDGLNVDSCSPNSFLLAFSVSWDREHGAAVWSDGDRFQFGKHCFTITRNQNRHITMRCTRSRGSRAVLKLIVFCRGSANAVVIHRRDIAPVLKITLDQWLRTGRIGPLSIGDSVDDVMQLLGATDIVGPKPKNRFPSCWLYDELEFGFDDERKIKWIQSDTVRIEDSRRNPSFVDFDWQQIADECRWRTARNGSTTNNYATQLNLTMTVLN